MSLELLRREWEPQTSVSFKIEYYSRGAKIVVITLGEKYTANRYFKLGGRWHISADKREVSAHDMFLYLISNPADPAE